MNGKEIFISSEIFDDLNNISQNIDDLKCYNDFNKIERYELREKIIKDTEMLLFNIRRETLIESIKSDQTIEVPFLMQLHLINKDFINDGV